MRARTSCNIWGLQACAGRAVAIGAPAKLNVAHKNSILDAPSCTGTHGLTGCEPVR